MKRLYWFFLIISAILYALPFLLSEYVWWLIFIFPIPLLYVMSFSEISFLQMYLWGCVVFGLHLSGGIYLIASMAHELWFIGLALGIVVVLYQALFPALIFSFLAYGIRFFNITIFITRLFIYAIGLWLFIVWVDWYSMWIFGIKEGYPLMHPLIVLAQRPRLLWLISIIGKQLLTIIFLLISVECVIPLLLRQGFVVVQVDLPCILSAPLGVYRRIRASAVGTILLVIVLWLLCLIFSDARRYPLSLIFTMFQLGSPSKETEDRVKLPPWYCQVKSLPYMACATGKDPTVIIIIVSRLLKKIIKDYPQTELIIMPESAFNINDFAQQPEILQLLNTYSLGKPIHIIFGASRWCDNNYYNSLHWVYDGVLQDCCDKRHAMLISERLSPWMDNALLRSIYFNNAMPISISCTERKQLQLFDAIAFVPYICSELFFNETPDDDYNDIPIIVIVNDSLFVSNMYSFYIAKLLLLLAQFKAIQWKRDIVYVSYTRSLFIDRRGMLYDM